MVKLCGERGDSFDSNKNYVFGLCLLLQNLPLIFEWNKKVLNLQTTILVILLLLKFFDVNLKELLHVSVYF